MSLNGGKGSSFYNLKNHTDFEIGYYNFAISIRFFWFSSYISTVYTLYNCLNSNGITKSLKRKFPINKNKWVTSSRISYISRE